MKGLHILILSIFLSLPLAGNAVVHFPTTDVISYQTEKTKKKEKPRKRFKKWLKNHRGILILGGFTLAGTAMLILGIVWKIRWLWLLGLFTILAPWMLAIIIVLLMLIFGFGHKKPPMIDAEPIPQEEKESKNEK